MSFRFRTSTVLVALAVTACKPEAEKQPVAAATSKPASTQVSEPVPSAALAQAARPGPTLAECDRVYNAETIQITCSGVINSNADTKIKAKAYLHRADYGWTTSGTISRLSDYDKAIELDPDSIHSWIRRARFKASQKQEQEALADLDKALARQPDSVAAIDERGDILRDLKETEKAKTEWRKAADFVSLGISKKTDDAELHKSRARLRVKLEDTKGALEDFNKAVRLQPAHAPYDERAQLYRSMGRFYDAVADQLAGIKNGQDFYGSMIFPSGHIVDGEFRFADIVASARIESSGNDKWAHRYRSEARLELGEMEASLVDAFKSIELDPKSSDAHGARAAYFVRSGETARALADLDKATQLAPDEALWYIRRAEARALSGEPERAQGDYRRALELVTTSLRESPESTSYLTTRAECLQALGDFDAALVDIDKAITVDPLDVAAFAQRAALYELRREHEKARADHTRIATIASAEFAETLRQRAWALFRLGKNAEGLTAIEGSIERQPNAPRYLIVRAQIFEALGRREEAVSDYRRALSRNKSLGVAVEGLKRLDAK